jgi:hypothetical protein
MAKDTNITDSTTIRVTLSVQSEELLQRLAKQGIYGRNPAEVAGRFVDEALRKFVEPLKLNPKIRNQKIRRLGRQR